MIINRNDNMLLRIAQADAYAVAVEYVKREEHEDLFTEMLKFERFHQHPTYHKLSAGCYTDDTQMSIAISEILQRWEFWRRTPNSSPTSESFLRQFFYTFKNDPRDGYSRKFQEILEKSASIDELAERIIPDSRQNGAAMRSVPLGVVDIDQILDIAREQAIVTHNTPEGIASSQAVALMSHFALQTDYSFSDLVKWGCDQGLMLFDSFKEDWEGRVKADAADPNCPGTGVKTAHAVCTLLKNEKSLMDIMRKTLEWGGDTDSVASIAWGIASARYVNENIPAFLEQNLEPGGKYGPRYLKQLGSGLMNRYGDL